MELTSETQIGRALPQVHGRSHGVFGRSRALGGQSAAGVAAAATPAAVVLYEVTSVHRSGAVDVRGVRASGPAQRSDTIARGSDWPAMREFGVSFRQVSYGRFHDEAGP